MQDKVYAYKVVDNVVHSTRIEVTALPEQKLYVVHSGLEKGEIIVAEGVGLLRDETRITIKQE